MGINSLKGVTQVAGEKVAHIEFQDAPVEINWSETPIVVNHVKNTITFKIQEGTIKENGKNGCQAVDMISVARAIIASLNTNIPCKENTKTLMHLDEAVEWQEARKANREARGVEGTREA